MSKKKEGKKKQPYAMDCDISYTQNREISWLMFNRRVLEEAMDQSVPLFERLKFVSIFQSNLDEFFMIRVGSLTDIAAIRAEDLPDNKSGWTAAEQLARIFRFCGPLYKMMDKAYADIERDLAAAGVERLTRKDMRADEKRFIDRWYRSNALPILSPQVIDQHHPFPHIGNNQQHIMLRLKSEERMLFGVLPVPPSLPPFVRLPGEGLRFILTEDVLLSKVPALFEGFRVQSKAVIKVTRNADISPDDEAFDMDGDFRQHMKKLLKKRGRLAPVRLEYQGKVAKPMLDHLCVRLGLDTDQIYASQAPLKLGYVFALADQLPDAYGLTYPAFTPQPSPHVDENRPVIDQALEGDLLLHFPYEDITPYLRMMREAARDPRVASIRITIYRVASKSKLIGYLCEAAENGKDVTVLVELRARFDEQNNIEWAERLEEAGCTVIYGIEELKVHSKICLLTLTGEQGVRYVTQIGTGNYNEKTAALYTDFSLFTANQTIGADASSFFKNMALGNPEGEYRALLVAPHAFKEQILALIDGEIAKAQAGRACRVLMKLNSLTDRDVIDRLSEASRAGVPVDLIVRGICCLVPRVPGKTDHIRIRSIVGRFLEHSRVYCFGRGGSERLYIGSADLMTRNTEKRVEVACPVWDRASAGRIKSVLQLMLDDNVKARELNCHGEPVPPKIEEGAPPIDCQLTLMRQACGGDAEDTL